MPGKIPGVIGDGDDQKTFQEVVEITRPPTWTASAWLFERKYPEQYSRKHLEVNARVTNTEPPPVMQLVIVDPVKKRETTPEAAYEREQGLEPLIR